MRTLRIGWVRALVVGLLLAVPARTDTLVNPVKATYLFNFTKFVEWPASAFQGPGSDLVIGVAGDCGIFRVLSEVVREETVGGRRLVVRPVAGAPAAGCHIVFVCLADPTREAALISGSRRPGLLTVGESEGFLKRGGVIRFHIKDNKVRFAVSLANANAAGIKISSKLLKVATIEEPPAR